MHKCGHSPRTVFIRKQISFEVNIRIMKKIFFAVILIAAIIFSAGCVTEKSYTDAEGNIYTGDEASGSIKYADGSVETWNTDAEGNVRHVFKDKDGTVIKYYFNKNGELIYED